MNHTTPKPILSVERVSKHFEGLVALDQVSLHVHMGEVIALLGENGAGKSTLIKLISGVYQLDEGHIFFDGKPVTFATPLDARRLGIETIYQDLALCDNLDASANVFLGRELCGRGLLGYRLKHAGMLRETEQILAYLDIHLPDIRRPIRMLSGGQRQSVAIARAVYWNARLLIMDEPTAALGIAEQQKVLKLIETLRARGISILLISHNLRDVFAVADRAIVMRQGRVVGERVMSQTSENELVGFMIGSQGEYYDGRTGGTDWTCQ